PGRRAARARSRGEGLRYVPPALRCGVSADVVGARPGSTFSTGAPGGGRRRTAHPAAGATLARSRLVPPSAQVGGDAVATVAHDGDGRPEADIGERAPHPH